jgi:hypothetical protein
LSSPPFQGGESPAAPLLRLAKHLVGGLDLLEAGGGFLVAGGGVGVVGLGEAAIGGLDRLEARERLPSPGPPQA